MNTKYILSATIAILLLINISAAGPGSEQFQPGSQNYQAPVLEHSVLPDPVSYAPGKMVEGYVTMELKIDQSGKVEGVKVLYRTSTLAVKSAVRAVENWKFQPATLNNEPVTSYVAYSVPFGSNLQIFANENYIDRVLDPVNGDQIAMK